MRTNMIGSLSGLLLPLAAYAAPQSYVYRPVPLPRTALHEAMLPAIRGATTVRDAIAREPDSLTIAAGTPVRELVIIDAAVPDKHVFYRAVKPGVEIVEISANEPGLAQLASILAHYRNLAALHIVSHAVDGEILLGSSRISAENIKDEAQAFASLDGALRNGADLLLYGCDLAAGIAGEELLDMIQRNTHLDVAASSNRTGSHALRGDWDLEIHAGDIEAELPFSAKALKDFSAVLAPATTGTKSFADAGWSTSAGTLTSTHFVVSGVSGVTPVDVYVYEGVAIFNTANSLNNYFYVKADGVNTATFELTGLAAAEYFDESINFTNVRIVGIKPDGSEIPSAELDGDLGTGDEDFIFGAGQLSGFSGVQLKAFKLYFDTTTRVGGGGPNTGDGTLFDFTSFTIANAVAPPDSDGNVTAAGGVTEPVGLSTTKDTTGEAVNVFDFTISDGGTADGLPLTVSQIVVPVSGTATDVQRDKITWRLNGPGVSNVTGTYSAASDTITFPGLSISVTDGGNATYAINAYYKDNTGITDGSTVILSIDGDTNFTTGANDTRMGPTAAVTNGTGTTLDVIASTLVFTTQPSGSVSGSALTQQPVVTARDAFGNTDTNFAETITLTENGVGTLTNGTQAATNGVATFTSLIYTATADQEKFTLTANDQDGVGTNLPTVDASELTSNVVATKLVFTTEPVPTTVQNKQSTAFTTVPVVSARDANNILDTGYGTGITLAETNGAGSATMTATGDSDGSPNTVTVAPSSGVATFTGLELAYTVSGSSAETFNLRASSGGLTTADSTQLTANVADSDGSLTSASDFTGAVALSSTVNTTSEAVDVLDFTLADGGTSDGQALTATAITVKVSGTSTDADRGKILWRLNGPDVVDKTVTYDAGTDTITFSGLNISVADGGSETYVIDAYFGDTTTIADGVTVLLSIDGDTDVTLGGGTRMGSTTAVTNGAGTRLDVIATALAFTTQPSGSVSGAALTQQPAVAARDTYGNIDTDFTETITLTLAAGAGSVTSNTATATAGVATFSGLTYTATADQESFQFTANDDDGVGSNLAAIPSGSLKSDVVATKLLFTTQPAPLTGRTGVELDFATDPVVKAVDANSLVDTGWATGIALAEVNGSGSAAMTSTGDTDGNGATVTVTPASGVATFSNLKATYTNLANSDETWNLQASSGALTTADSSQLTSSGLPTIGSATYDALNGTLVVTGTNFEANSGDDVDATKLVIAGEGGSTHRLTTTGVNIDSATQFTVNLNLADRAAVNQLLNSNGSTSTGGTTYNLQVDDDFVTAVTSGNTADATTTITVSNVAAPTISSAAYDHDANAIILNGSGFLARAGMDDIDATKITVTGEGGASYTLQTSSGVEITDSTTATIYLSGFDIPSVEALLNNNGSVSGTSNTPFTLTAADDWNTGAAPAADITDASNPLTVSNFQLPAVTSAVYDASTGALTVTGTNLVTNAGATNDVDVSLLRLFGGNSESYALTDSADVELTSATEFTVTLSATDRLNVNGVLNKNGASSGSGINYNLQANEDWMPGAPVGEDVVDVLGNGITVSNTQAPTITSATYNQGTGVVVVTGTNFVRKVGGNNDIDLSTLTFTGGVFDATHTLTTATDVEITSDTAFTFTLSGADKAAVDQLLDQVGTSSTGGSTYNLSAADNWLAGADASANIADSGPHTVTASVPPSITSSTYSASTGVLVVTGSSFVANGSGADIDVSQLTFTGEGGEQYALTDTADVEIDNIGQFTLTLSATDKAAVNLMLNRNGLVSTGSTAYNLAAGDDYVTAVTDGDTADGTNAITASNVAVPAITGATYDATAGTLVVTGTGFLKASGATNDIDVSKLGIAGEGGATYDLTTSDVEITSGTTFTVTLSAADRLAVNQLTNKAGTQSTGGTTYNLSAAEDWARGADAAVTVADGSGNGITVSNIPVPAITSATYDAATGVLVVTGTDLLGASGATNDVDVSKLTLSGEGGVGHTLTTANVEIDSATQFTVTLNATDKAIVNMSINKNGASATGGAAYNLAAAEDWAAGADAAVTVADTTGNTVTASNVAVPVITSVSFDYDANTLSLTGTGFLKLNGATNDIDVSTLAITGEGGNTYTLSTSSDVEITDGTSATITLGGADIAAVRGLLNSNGSVSATSATPFNLAAAEDWNTGADGGVSIADASTAITVSNYVGPAITSATYDAATGVLVVTGTNLVAHAAGDVDVSLLTLFGGSSEAYTLTDSADVELTSDTEFSVTLSAADRLSVNGVLNANGTSSGSGTTYDLQAADDWMPGAPAGNDITDAAGNGITVSNTQAPTITGATYDSTTGVVVVTGANFVHKVGIDNDIDLSALTFTGGVGNATYTLTAATDVEITSDSSFTFTLAGADATGVAALLDQLGTSSAGGSTYNLAAADNWLTGADVSADIADGGPNAVDATIPPTLTSSMYDASTGQLVVTGTNFAANGSGADIDVSLLTLTGEGGEQVTLTDTLDVERDSVSQFTVTLSATDKAAVNVMLNKNGTASTGGTTYNLAAADDYVTATTAGDTADATNGVTVSNVAAPTLTSAAYDAATGTLVVTGTDLVKRAGATNDIDASALSITGEGGESYTLTDSADVEITSSTAFTVTLGAADKAAIDLIVNKIGASATGGTTYNLAAAEDWAAGADAAVTIADTTATIAASNVAVPAITGATYAVNTGTLTVSGTGFAKFAGAANDIDASAFSITGKDGTPYTLTTTPDVDVISGTSFTLTLDATDRIEVDKLLDANGPMASDNTAYNFAVAEDWTRGADAALTIADATNTLSVAGIPEPDDDDEVIDEETDNEGNTLTDVTITEEGEVQGGTLDGEIVNDGVVRDVTLTADTVITGDGTVSGTITGDPDAPATIETNIAGDAVLTNIVIGADATVDPNAQLAGNVRFESEDNIPPGLDLTRALDAIPWESRPQTLAVNLDTSLLAEPGPDDLTLLQQIRALDEYEQLDFAVEQDQQTGELVVADGDFNARLVPVSVTQAAPGTPPGTSINADGNVEIVTERGVRVVSYPAPADSAALESSFANNGLGFGFNELGNLEVTGVDAVQYNGRPVATAVPAFRSTTPGLHFHGVGAPANATGVSMIYEDADGVLWEQELVPVPSDWPALKNRLQQLPGATDTRISQDGIVSVMVNGNVIRARAAYVVTPGTPTGSSTTQLTPAGDLNGDGIGDYIMTFPDGSTQSLLILP